MPDERRVHPRAELDGRATLFSGDRRAAVPIVDISESGCALRCPTPSQVGTFLRVNFRLPESSDKWLDVDGVVRHMSPSSGGDFRYGIQFVSPSASCVAAVRHYVRSRLQAQPHAPQDPRPQSRPPQPVRTKTPTGEERTQPSPDADPPIRRRPSSTTMRAIVRRKAAAADQSDPEFRRLYREALDDLDN